MKFLLFQAMLICVGLNVALGQGVVSGTIVDSKNQPLPDVSISIQSLNKGTTSDGLGRFSLHNIPPGTYDVSVTSLGYGAQQKSVIVTETPVIIKISLEQGELMLADVVITDQLNKQINTISQVDIKLRPVNTSQDILRMVPGLFIAQHAGGGKSEQIFLRGFDIDHGTDINLEVDGLPVNMVSHAHGQGYSDLHFLIPELIGKVDFNKGPYTADKGNFTTAGYASFYTKNVLDQNMVKVEGGRFGTLRNVNAINIFNSSEGVWQKNLYVASEYFRTDGYFEANQNFNRLNLNAKYNAYRDDKEALSIGISTFNSRWDASGQVPVRAIKDGSIARFGSIDPTEGGETSRTNAWIKYTNTQDNGGVFENQLSFSKYDFYLVSNFTFFLNDPINGDQITQSESRNIYSYRGSYTRSTNLGSKILQSELGAGFRYDDVNDIHLYHTKSRKQFLDDVARGDVDETNLFAYVNETLTLSDKLSLNAAVRLDHFTFNYVDALTPLYNRQSVSKAVVSPKLNVSYDLSQSVNLFAKTGIGFHSNDTRVVVAQNGNEILPSAFGADIGANFKVGNKLVVSTALWMLDLEQEFVYVGDEGIVEPSGETQRRGLDVSMRYQALPWLYVDTDVNVTNPKAKGAPEGEDHIPLAPTFTSIGGLSVKFQNGFSGSLRYRYLGDRAANEDNSVVAEGYFLMDAVLKYTRKSFEVSFAAENILDEEWNEAQFDTESRLENEVDPVSEIHFTPGTPFFFKAGITFFF
ncbi:TonB-dependent receptor [Pseudochryseolinea flava]|uniref:TonB-dependent receptor n=1 Tax=Pseudochryseolinea flava TaxID=2059302 RepID=A0A364Y5I3_9BACT|nr:TonB-dependent receptor [Pseudochryseolinea flava]RAW02256.1 TonB-dependent receptor [Pseudochryseolinea flava]